METSYEYQVGGSLPVDAPTYVNRQADQDLIAAIRAGQFCYVLTARQMGKSSLKVQTARRLVQMGYTSISIDLTEIGSQNITPAQWYAGIIHKLWMGLGLGSLMELRTWLQEREILSPVQRCLEFLETLIIQPATQPIVLFLDEIDSVLGLPFGVDEFFGLIRHCYERRAEHPTDATLTFGLFGVATPSDLIQDQRSTPFNIGCRIELTGFKLAETAPLIAGLQVVSEHPTALMQTILDWTGGQPFLTQKVCQLVMSELQYHSVTAEAQDQWLSKLIQTQFIDHWESQDEPEHLRTIQSRLLSRPNRIGQLLVLYQRILEQGSIVSDGSLDQMELCLSGLAIRQQGRLTVHNRIYAAVFNQDWMINEALANLRPYREALATWLASGRKSTFLLQGQALEEALHWAEQHSLDELDQQFLVTSQNQAYQVEQRLMQQLKQGWLYVLLSTAILAIHNVTVGGLTTPMRLFDRWLIGGVALSGFGSALLLVWLRMMVAVPLLGVVVKTLHPPVFQEIRQLLQPSDRAVIYSTLASGICLFLSQVLFYHAIGQIGPALAVTLLSVYPLISVGLNYLGSGDRPSYFRSSSALAILAGVLLTATPIALGDCWSALLSGGAFALYLALMQPSFQTLHPITISFIQFLTSLIGCSVGLALAVGLRGVPIPLHWPGVALGGLILGVLTVAGYLFNNIGVRLMGGKRASALASSGPALTVMLFVLLFPTEGRLLHSQQMGGMLLVILGYITLGFDQLLSGSVSGKTFIVSRK